MKTDAQLKDDVTAELLWDAAVNAAQVGVAVKEGVVTLSGQVDSYVQKHAIENAVRRVAGVRGIALDLEVKLAPGHERTDTRIAQAVLHALGWHSLVPAHQIQVKVDDGWVTLSGQVDWPYQSACAEQAVQPLVGVRGLTNRIAIKQQASPSEIRGQITEALTRHAQREARHIEIHVEGSVVTLRGKVDSLAEHDAALGTAQAAKGVTRVVDCLRVDA